MNAAARFMQTLRYAAMHLKTSQHFLQHALHKQRTQALVRQAQRTAQHSTARAPLQPHLHFLHATPRHTLHHHFSPAPRHVHIGRRGGQSLAHKRHTGEHETHSPTRRTFRDNAAVGRQRLLPTVMREKPLLAFDELERALDLRAKLLGRLQYAIVDEGK
jgi:hypothetical protein